MLTELENRVTHYYYKSQLRIYLSNTHYRHDWLRLREARTYHILDAKKRLIFKNESK